MVIDGAYENMTKDMNNEEKNSNVMHNVKSSDDSHKTSVFALDIMHLRYQYQNIVSSKDSFGITKGGTISFDARRFNISNN